MKNILVVMLLFLQAGVKAQSVTTPVNFPVNGELVRVLDWGSRSIMLGTSFFNETKDSIILRIGQEEFDEMKSKCSSSGWPEGIYKSGLSDEEDKAFDQKLNELKMYKIASFTHKYNGKTFDRYVILRVPFEENKLWDPPMQWGDNIYFLLKEKDIQLIQ